MFIIFNFYFHFGLPGENGCNLTTILSDGLKPPSRKCSNENFESTKNRAASRIVSPKNGFHGVYFTPKYCRWSYGTLLASGRETHFVCKGQVNCTRTWIRSFLILKLER